MTRHQRFGLVLLFGTVVGLYCWRLPHDPIYLVHDEVLYSVQAHAIATTARDTNGRFLPLYFLLAPGFWASPMFIYALALILQFVHLSEATIRVPSVLAGLMTIGPMYWIGRRVFGSPWYGLLAAVSLALTPALFFTSRFKVEAHFPLPFVVSWLHFVLRYDETRRLRWLVAAGVALGLGLYAYHAGPIMMPVYVVLTLWVLWNSGDLRARPVAALVASFALLAAPTVLFVMTQPGFLTSKVNQYHIYDANRLGLLQGLVSLANWPVVKMRLGVYYQSFSPSPLFFSGSAGMVDTTRMAGMFLLSFAVLLPVGAYHIVRRRPLPGVLCLAGFVSAPLASTIVGDSGATRRLLVILPFATLIAVYGVRRILESRSGWRRWAGIGLLIAMPVQFTWFCADYFGDYRQRSAFWFEGNIRAALEAAIDAASRAPAPTPVFISSAMNPYIDRYWTFYLLKNDQPDLESRTRFFDSSTTSDELFPDGAIIVAEANGRDRLTAQVDGLTELARAYEPDGTVSFYVWSRHLGSGQQR